MITWLSLKSEGEGTGFAGLDRSAVCPVRPALGGAEPGRSFGLETRVCPNPTVVRERHAAAVCRGCCSVAVPLASELVVAEPVIGSAAEPKTFLRLDIEARDR